MTQSLAIPRVIPNDWKRLDLIVNKIKFRLGSASSPIFTGVTITGLTASSLVGTNASKLLESVTIGSSLTYTRPTLDAIQDIQTTASPLFAGLHINSAEVVSTTLLTLESDISNNNEYNEILFKIAGGVNYGAIRSCVGATGGDSYMSLLTTTDGGTLVQQVTVQHDGKVRFGPGNPSQKLDIVAGNSGVLISDTGEGRGVAKSLFFGDGGGTWTPIMWGVAGAFGDAGLHLLAETEVADDSGAEPLIRLNARQIDSTPITTRPILAIENDRNQLVIVDKDGNVSITGAVTGTSFITAGNIGVVADTDLLQLAANTLTVNGTITLPLANEINFRDSDISIGSPFDGKLDINADVSVGFFYDNVDVGDEVDGQSVYINRRAGEGDDYIRLYVDKDRKGLIGFSGTDDLLKLATNALTVNGTIRGLNSLFLGEQASALADVEGKGQLWVKTATPNTLWFTDDAGTDYQLNLIVGTDIQAHGAVLDDLNTLGAVGADSEFLVGTGAGALVWENATTSRTSLGLGTGDSPVFTALKLGTNYATTGSIRFPAEGYIYNRNTANNADLFLIGFSGDSIYVGYTQDSIFLRASSAAQATITSTGMGIKTTPGCAVDVNGTIRCTGIGSPTTGAGCEILYTANIGYFITFDRDGVTAKASHFGGDGSSGIRVDTAGKVAVGTTPKTLFTVEGTITLKEQAAADGDTAAYGQDWVKNTAPCTRWFTDDTGVDHEISFNVKTITSSTDAADVASCKLLLIDATSGNITIGGFANGIENQIVEVFKYTTTNNLILEHNEGSGTQKLFNIGSSDIPFNGVRGSITYICKSNIWYQIKLKTSF